MLYISICMVIYVFVNVSCFPFSRVLWLWCIFLRVFNKCDNGSRRVFVRPVKIKMVDLGCVPLAYYMVENLKKKDPGCVFSICFVLHVAGLNSPLIFYWILEIFVDHVAVEMIGLFDSALFRKPVASSICSLWFRKFFWQLWRNIWN